MPQYALEGRKRSPFLPPTPPPQPMPITPEKKAAKEAVDQWMFGNRAQLPGVTVQWTGDRVRITFPKASPQEIASALAQLPSDIILTKTICEGEPIRIT
jgi:hypothetical protein